MDYTSDKSFGPPRSGRYQDGDTFTDASGTKFTCVETGSPGKWDALGADAPDYGWWQAPDGYSLQDDFEMYSNVDVGNGYHLTGEQRYEQFITAGGSIAVDTKQEGQLGWKGLMTLDCPAGGDQVMAGITGDYIIDGNTPNPGQHPIWDLRAYLGGAVQNAASSAVLGIFRSAYGVYPVLNTDVGAWFQLEWNVDHVEIHGHMYDGVNNVDLLLRTPANQFRFDWLRCVLDIENSTVEFFASEDGKTWTSIGSSAIDQAAWEGTQTLLAHVNADTLAAALRIDFWRLDNRNAVRGSFGS
jgi:hypothetical protein